MTPARAWRLLLPGVLAACASSPSAPPVDAGVDTAPAIDVPGIDAKTTPDVSAPDVSAPDVAPPDDVALDAFVSTSTTCSLAVQGEFALPATRVTGVTSGFSRVDANCIGTSGPEHIYTLRLPSRRGVQLFTEATFDPVLMIRRACNDPGTEIACNDDGPGGLDSFVRRVLDPGEYDVIIDRVSGSSGGPYALTLRTWTPVANADCSAGIPLTPGTPVTGDTLTGGAASIECLNRSWGPQLFYTLTVPPGRRAVLTATPTGAADWTPVLRARQFCAAPVCLANATAPAAGSPAVMRFDNHYTNALPIVVTVSSATGVTGGTFSLDLAFADAPPSPPHALCSMARELADGARLADEDVSVASTPLTAHCVPTAQGAALFYRLSVPPGATGVVTATPRPGWNPVLRTIQACSIFACLASADVAGDGEPESIGYVNTGTAPRDVIVAVAAQDASNGGRFDLTAAVNPAPANVTCAAPLTVSSGSRLTFQNALQGVDSALRACLPGSPGTALWYRAVVPAGQTLTARVTPVGAADVAVRVLDACAATSCLASVDAGGAGVTETLSYGNAGTAERTVLVAVSGGSFHLETTLDRLYLETSVPTACEELVEGDSLPGVNADESMTSVAALPFGVTFFGRPMAAYSASSNGYLQLYPSVASATPAMLYDNVPIPTAAAPNGMVAAFWDDLLPLSGSRVQAHTFGSSPSRRFVFQWAGFAFPRDVRARLTFQVKLFETSGAVEIHHCVLTPGTDVPRATGSSATVGLESPDGRAGRQHSFNDATGLSATRALRFVP